jgi:hypothetical protein
LKDGKKRNLKIQLSTKCFKLETSGFYWPKAETLHLLSSRKSILINIEQFPFLNWIWRIENRLDTENEKNKSGDDYAARIYVIIDGGIFKWRTKAVNYVWANQASKGEIWENAFAGKNAQMMALRNRQDKLSTWYSEKRNVYKDLKRLFGTQFHSIDAIAIMTDTDNSHGHGYSCHDVTEKCHGRRGGGNTEQTESCSGMEKEKAH